MRLQADLLDQPMRFGQSAHTRVEARQGDSRFDRRGRHWIGSRRRQGQQRWCGWRQARLNALAGERIGPVEVAHRRLHVAPADVLHQRLDIPAVGVGPAGKAAPQRVAAVVVGGTQPRLTEDPP